MEQQFKAATASVTTTHKDYDEFEDVWESMRDHLAGQRRIKEKTTEYLPFLGDPSDPEDQERYRGFLDRALYYEATKRTRDAMLGAILSKPPKFNNLPDKYNEQFMQVTMDGYSMDTFMRNVLSELIGVSRTGVLVERAKEQDGGEMYLVQYKAEDIINWRFERVMERIVLTMVVLREVHTEEDGRFGTKEVTKYRVLEMTDGIYTQTVFTAVLNDKNEITYKEADTIVPTNKGRSLDFIPFVFFTPLGNVPTICEPVLSSIAAINLSHYLTSADLEHGRHFTGLPTAWVAGFDTESKLRIGSQIAWVSDNPNARAGFLEFTGTGLNSLVIALQEKQEQMATMGARMLRPPRAGVEAAETARIYQSGESGTLASLAKAASEAFTTLMEYWLEWDGADPKDVSVEFNTDYVDTRIDGAMLNNLVSAYLQKAISFDTLFYNLQQGEIIPDNIDIEQERGLIEIQGPVLDDNEPQ